MLLYSGNKVVVEFLAFAMCISYVIFLFVYFQEYELRNPCWTIRSAYQYAVELPAFGDRAGPQQRTPHEDPAARHAPSSCRHPDLSPLGNRSARLIIFRRSISNYDDTVIHSFLQKWTAEFGSFPIYQTRFSEKSDVLDVQVQTLQTLCCSEMTFCAILSIFWKMLCMRSRSSLWKNVSCIWAFWKGKPPSDPAEESGFSDTCFFKRYPGYNGKESRYRCPSVIYYVEKEHGQYQFYMEGEDFVVRIIL